MSANSEEDVQMRSGDEGEGGEDHYEVEEITDKKKISGKWQYKVKWVGYPDSQSTWEPKENLDNVKQMLIDFEEDWAKKNSLDKNSGLKKSIPASEDKKKKEPLRESKVNNKKTKRDDDDDDFEEEMENKPKKKSRVNQEEREREFVEEPKKKPQKKENKNNPPTSKNLSLVASAIERLRHPGADPIVFADNDSEKIYGSFEANDEPKTLITAKLVTETNQVNCLVEWHARKSGIKPSDTFVTNKILREKCPHLLLDFYESRLRFPSASK
jgi:hypothetical protein